MNQFISAAMAICLLCFTNADAQHKILRVGYGGPHINRVDYSDLQSAHDAADSGDIIYLFPSGNGNPWTATYSKKLTTISYGYYVDTATLGTKANAGLQNIKGFISASITLFPGAGGNVFEGIDSLFISNEGSFFSFYDEDNITIERCNVNIQVRYNVQSNWKILQSNVNMDWSGSTLTSLLISNCIVNSFVTSTNAGQSVVLNNNIFTGTWNDGSTACIYRNNVFLATGSFALESGSDYQYNVFVGNPTSNKGLHNLFKQNKDSIFVGYSNQKTFSNDGRWRLKQNSVAINAGENGIDCGIYAQGSDYPYKLSGIPAIPAFYRLDAPSIRTDNTPTYKITFSVRGNN